MLDCSTPWHSSGERVWRAPTKHSATCVANVNGWMQTTEHVMLPLVRARYPISNKTKGHVQTRCWTALHLWPVIWQQLYNAFEWRKREMHVSYGLYAERCLCSQRKHSSAGLPNLVVASASSSSAKLSEGEYNTSSSMS